MKRRKIKDSIGVTQGSSGNWYVRVNGFVIAGFKDENDARIFVEARFPNAKIVENA